MRMSNRFAFSIFVTIALVATFPAFADQPCLRGQSASLDFAADPTGNVSIPATINGQSVFLTVDTGGGASMLDDGTAKDWHLTFEHSRHHTTVTGGIDTNKYAEVDTFKLGSLPETRLKFAILRSSKTGNQAVHTLGADVLGQHSIEIDFAARKFNVFPPNACEDGGLAWIRNAQAVVPMTPDDQNKIIFPVMVDGHPVTAELDTGSDATIMRLKTARDVFGWNADSHQFQSLTIMNIEIRDREIQIRPDDFFDTDVPQMLLGRDILRQFHIFVAYREHELYLTTAP